MTYKDLKSIPAAIDCFKRALVLDPDCIDAINNLGVAQKMHGHFDLAIKTFNQIIKLRPERASAYLNLGVCFQDKGDYDAAIAVYERSIQIQPELAQAHYNLGGVLIKKRCFDSAIKCLQRAIEIKPSFVMAICDLGIAYQESAELKIATKKYIESLVIDPESTKSWNNVFFTLRSLHLSGDPDLDLFYEKLSAVDKNKTQYSVLRHRLASFQPHLADGAFDHAIKTMSANAAADISNPQVPASSDMVPLVPEKMIAMLHFGRSGTGLLHSLIDHHSEISTLPSIYFSEYFDADNWQKLIANGWDQLPENFVRQYEVLFDASAFVPVLNANSLISCMGVAEGMANVGENRDEVLTVDRDIFCSELRRLMSYYPKLGPSTFFTLVHAAYESTLNTSSDKHTMFYHIHNPSEYSKLNFIGNRPDARFVMMVREPLKSCESWLSRIFKDKSYGFSLVSIRILTMLFDIDQIAFRKCDSVGVRLEDLKLHPEETMTSLCDWMGIKVAPSLYEMTAQGKKWWGDPSSVDYSDAGMSPFGDECLNRPVGAIFSDRDQFILRTFFYPFSVRFGYVEEDLAGFRRDLAEIKPMLSELFDFEKTIVKDKEIAVEQYKKSISYLYLRAGLLDRWKVLDEFNDYPHMLVPLKIKK